MGNTFASNPTLARDDDSLAHLAHLLEHVAKNFLRHAIGIHVCMIKQGVAGFVRGDDGFASIRFALGTGLNAFRSENAPAAVGKTADLNRALAQRSFIHAKKNRKPGRQGVKSKSRPFATNPTM